MNHLAVRFDPALIPEIAARYDYASDEHIQQDIVPRTRTRGYLSRPDFLEICRWKSPRTRRYVEALSARLIRETSRIALSTPYEELRIGVLTLLHGVSWATASAILHFCHRGRYPIIDYRALWSLGQAKSDRFYAFGPWCDYVTYCRALAAECHVSMRTLDRALWQYSKENQP